MEPTDHNVLSRVDLKFYLQQNRAIFLVWGTMEWPTNGSKPECSVFGYKMRTIRAAKVICTLVFEHKSSYKFMIKRVKPKVARQKCKKILQCSVCRIGTTNKKSINLNAFQIPKHILYITTKTGSLTVELLSI